MRILSWNINGIRSFEITAEAAAATSNKQQLSSGWMEAVSQCDPDIVTVQETKITRDNLDEAIAFLDGFTSYFAFSRKRTGYSGVATFCKTKTATPVKSEEGLGGTLPSALFKDAVGCYDGISQEFSQDELKALDAEGRCVITQHKLKNEVGGKSMLAVVNVYCPRADPDDVDRETFKMKFYKLLELRCRALERSGSHVIVLGDINTSHHRIDHCDPYEQFEERSGRQWMSHFLGEAKESQLDTDEGVSDWRISEAVRSQLPGNSNDNVFVDSFRHLHFERKEAFTCWNTKMNCRATNFGTRIDYILINKGLVPALTESDIRPDIMGSDHCPIYASFDLDIAPSATLSTYCTANFLEFSGKQQKISKFFVKKTDVPSAVEPPPAKKQKTVKQSTLGAFFVKKQQMNASPVAPTKCESVEVSQVALKSDKNCKAVTDWKMLMKGPPPAPLCKGHKEPCVDRVVKKPGPNQGRKFWCCARGEGKAGDPNARCDYFLWQTKSTGQAIKSAKL